MLTVDEALVRARSEMTRLFPELGQDVRLEELETPLAASAWKFTFSAFVPCAQGEDANALAALLSAARKRKVIELEPESGELISIKAA